MRFYPSSAVLSLITIIFFYTSGGDRMCLLPSTVVESADILAVFPYSAVSHFAAFKLYLRELYKRGHRLTVISHYPSDDSNYTDISLPSPSLPTSSSTTDDEKSSSSSSSGARKRTWDLQKLNVSIPLSVWTNMYFFYLSSQPMKHLLTNSPAFRNILLDPNLSSSNKTNHFDLILLASFNSRLFLSIPYRLNVPFVLLTSCTLFPFYGRNLGAPINPSYISSTMGGVVLHDRTAATDWWSSFWTRLSHTLNVAVNVAIFETIFENEAVSTVKRFFTDEGIEPQEGEENLSLRQIEKNCSLVLVNTYFSLNSPKPLPSNIVEVGGLHLNEPDKLPADIEKFINESEHGVVYFCMGSLLKGSSFPEDKRNAFLYAFSKIPQRVLWKWEGDVLPGKSNNIMTAKWMPQRDILAHPKVKLFISHGGLLGTNEAVYEGVPILGIPIFGDQRTNVKSIEASGAGEMLDYNEISKEIVLEKVQRLLNDPKYHENAKELSRRYRDRPMSPLDTAVYWTEYVIRHKGAHHLRSAAVDMAWYQYLLLDVIAFVIFVLVISLVIVYYSLKLTLRFVLNKFIKKQTGVGNDKKVKSN